jgi:2,4-dienoyl-CoA reductase-like NADH-dependent reductase (Old Yellow Enzyme family)
MPPPRYPRVASFRTATALAQHLEELGWRLPFDDSILASPESPLAQPIVLRTQRGQRRVGNRFAIQPMEGWDGEADGRPSDLTRRRWLRFGASGAKLLWGGEAVAVLPEARANPNQLLLNDRTAANFARLREEVVQTHRERFGSVDDFVFGLQLTHSGRFCRPLQKSRLEPVICYHHPLLDVKYPAAAAVTPVFDSEIGRIVEAFGTSARLARETGFDFVDLKHCHGYLAHEFLSGYHRPGVYGGSFENRTRFLRELVSVIHSSASGLDIGVRLSVFDSIPYYSHSEASVGVPMARPESGPYTWAFGVDAEDPARPDLTEAKRLLLLFRSMEVRLINVTASSPHYCPHLQRPALFPPCDGYLPPEDPLTGAARLLAAARELKESVPEMTIVSSGWSYFQDYLPHFGQALVRQGCTDFVGLGRMALAYPDLPAEVLEKATMSRKKICRTFSDCTNGPRNGLISGCYPLDPFYAARPEAQTLRAIKGGSESVVTAS